MTTSTSTAPPAAPGRYRGDLIPFMAVAFGASWACRLAAIGLGGPAMEPPAFLPYLLGAFGPAIGALVIRVRRARRGEPVPEQAVRFRRTALLRAPLLLVLAAAVVLAAAFLAQRAGGPAPTLEGATNTMMVLLGVDAPVPQSMIIGLQVIAVAVLLATHRPRQGPAPAVRATPAHRTDAAVG